MMRRPRNMLACFIVVASLSGRALAGEATEDLAKYQGSWEWVAPTHDNGDIRRVVKDIAAKRETVTEYGRDGKVVSAHTVDFTLEDRDGIRVFTYTNWETTAGPGKGQRPGVTASYVYRLSDDVFIEALGLLPQEPVIGRMRYYVRRASAAQNSDEARKAGAALQGGWTMRSDQRGPSSRNDQVRLRFDGRTVTLIRKNIQFTGEVRIDPTRNPKFLDIVVREGPDAQATAVVVHGIYEIRGDELKFCSGLTRPTTLDEPGEGQTSIVLKHDK